MIKTVTAYIIDGEKYLLLFRNKKEHDINLNKYIGVGGHIEKGELVEEAMIREVKEETNLDVKKYEYRGIVIFSYDGYLEEMHVFTISEYSGSIKECNEGTLEWHFKKELRNLPMWEGDYYFLELLDSDTPFFKIKLIYNKDKLVEHIRIQ